MKFEVTGVAVAAGLGTQGVQDRRYQQHANRGLVDMGLNTLATHCMLTTDDLLKKSA